MILSWPLAVGAFLVQLASTSLAAVTVTTFAGTGFMGSIDGPRDAATFDGPYNMAIDSTGTLYTAESRNGRIRKITPDGIVSTIDVEWIFNRPVSISSIAVNPEGFVFATSWFSDAVYKITPGGNTSVFAGGDEPGYVDGTADVARFNDPRGLAFDSDGNMIVADSMNRCIRKITPNGMVSTLAGNGLRGNHDGLGREARFIVPHDVVVDSLNNVYVTDVVSQRIRKITPEGYVSTLSGTRETGHRDGPGQIARFMHPTGLAVDATGNAYLTDQRNHCIRMISPNGTVSTIAGGGITGFVNGPGRFARFNSPIGIAFDSDGSLLVADSGNHQIRKIAFAPGDDDDAALPESYGNAQPRPVRFNKDECAICYEVKAEGDDYDYCSTRCGHSFHRRCIDRCMRRVVQRKCPMCRSTWIANKPRVPIPAAPSDHDQNE